MEKANLPTGDAREPEEEASQPPNCNDPTILVNKKGFPQLRFEETAQHVQQSQSAHKDVLSQPPKNLTHKQKLFWLQKRRTEGLWAQCDDCDRWRYLPHVLDSHDLPQKWFCWMNPDSSLANCLAPEVPLSLHDEEDLIHSEYAAGSVVLARMPGWPWWPAMVDDCPDTEQYYWLDGFSDIPTHYNVVFFDGFEVTRAWIAPQHLKPYMKNTNTIQKSLKIKKYQKRLNVAIIQAEDAHKLSSVDRLAKYSFISRYAGTVHSPKKIRNHEAAKYQKQLKRKFNVDFHNNLSDSESDTENSILEKHATNTKKLSRKIKTKSSKTITLTDAATEDLTHDTPKDLNSLAVQIDSSSATRNASNRETEVSTNSGSQNRDDVETQMQSQNSGDFDF